MCLSICQFQMDRATIRIDKRTDFGCQVIYP